METRRPSRTGGSWRTRSTESRLLPRRTRSNRTDTTRCESRTLLAPNHNTYTEARIFRCATERNGDEVPLQRRGDGNLETWPDVCDLQLLGSTGDGRNTSISIGRRFGFTAKYRFQTVPRPPYHCGKSVVLRSQPSIAMRPRCDESKSSGKRSSSELNTLIEFLKWEYRSRKGKTSIAP